MSAAVQIESSTGDCPFLIECNFSNESQNSAGPTRWSRLYGNCSPSQVLHRVAGKRRRLPVGSQSRAAVGVSLGNLERSLFVFGYYAPVEHADSAKDGPVVESTSAVWVRADSEDEAAAKGRDYAYANEYTNRGPLRSKRAFSAQNPSYECIMRRYRLPSIPV